MARNTPSNPISRVSQFLRRNSNAPDNPMESPMTRARMFSVPIFLSPSTTASRIHLPPNVYVRDSQSVYSTQSNNQAPRLEDNQSERSPTTDRHADVQRDIPTNSDSDLNHSEQFRSAFSDDSSEMSVPERVQQSVNRSKASVKKRQLFSTSSLRNRRVRIKAKLSIAFGATLVSAIIICKYHKSWELTCNPDIIRCGACYHGYCKGYHVSCPFNFTNSCPDWIALPFSHTHVNACEKCRKGHSRGTHGHRRRPHRRRRHNNSQPWKSADAESTEDIPPEKPIPIFMRSDEDNLSAARPPNVILHPPPVYGNYRNSTRMNPNLVHWRVVAPSPRTPSYDEAMNDVQRVVGYRPPSYLSDTAVTESMERSGDIEAGLEDIHPLERERVQYLNSQQA